MPLYTYRNRCTGEVRDVIQRMDETHEYFGEDGTQDYWDRVFYPPNFSIDGAINPFSQEEFMRKTENKKGTVGDLMDRSAELSEKRAEQAGGEDPLKRKYFDEYAKARGGKKHIKDKPKVYQDKHIRAEFD